MCSFIAPILVVSLGLATACGGGIEDDVEDFFTAQNTFTEKVCECFDDTPECRSDPETGIVPQASIDCFSEIAAENADAVQPSIDCFNELYRDIVNCIQPLACTEEQALMECVADFETRANACPEIPADVDAQFDACDPDNL